MKCCAIKCCHTPGPDEIICIGQIASENSVTGNVECLVWLLPTTEIGCGELRISDDFANHQKVVLAQAPCALSLIIRKLCHRIKRSLDTLVHPKAIQVKHLNLDA